MRNVFLSGAFQHNPNFLAALALSSAMIFSMNFFSAFILGLLGALTFLGVSKICSFVLPVLPASARLVSFLVAAVTLLAGANMLLAAFAPNFEPMSRQKLIFCFALFFCFGYTEHALCRGSLYPSFLDAFGVGGVFFFSQLAIFLVKSLAGQASLTLWTSAWIFPVLQGFASPFWLTFAGGLALCAFLLAGVRLLFGRGSL